MLSIHLNQKDYSCLIVAGLPFFHNLLWGGGDDYPKNKFTNSNFSTFSSSRGKVIKYLALTTPYRVVIIMPIIRWGGGH